MGRRSWIALGLFAIPISLALGIAIGILFPGIWPFPASASMAAGADPPKDARPAPPLAPAKEAAQQLTSQWGYNPNPAPPNHSSSSGASGRRAYLDQYVRDNGKAKVWFDRAVTFYLEKCGSDFNPIASKKHIIGHNGTNKRGGQYVITEPGLLNIPLSQIPAQSNEIFFAYDDLRSSITILVRQQDNDVVTIMLIAGVR